MKLLSIAAAALVVASNGAMAEECPGLNQAITLLDDHAGHTHDKVTMYYGTMSTPEGLALCVRLEYENEGWVGFGISPAGTMLGGEAVIGDPANVAVEKYNLSTGPRIQKMDAAQQTLMHTSIKQVDGRTIVKFAKLVNEPGEHVIATDGSENTFLIAVGSSNSVSYHADRTAFTLAIDSTSNAVPVSTPSPTYSGAGSSDVGTSTGLIKTMSPTGGVPRRDSPTATPGAGTPVPTDTLLAPPVPTPNPTEPAKPSVAAMSKSKIGTLILGAGAVAVWSFGL